MRAKIESEFRRGQALYNPKTKYENFSLNLSYLSLCFFPCKTTDILF